MRIRMLDPGLKVVAGHHFDLDLRLASALRRRGHEVTVHGHAQPEPALVAKAEQAGMPFLPSFRVFPYGPLPEPFATAQDAYRAREQATALDLESIEKADLWLWPTLLPDQLAAAARHADVVAQIGGTWFRPHFPDPQGAPSWAATARRLAGVPHRIVVGAYDELLCQGYTSFTPRLDVERLPCPHDGAPNERRPTTLRRIGFFGHQRPNRGIDLVPELVDALVAQGYEVVLQDSGGSLKGHENDARVTVLQHIDDFAAELVRCDLVVWPSRWETYTQCLSGLVSESIASGVPVVLPSGCLPAQVVGRYGCGVYFHQFACADIVEAVAAAAQDFPGLCARARAAATAWHQENGTDRLAAWIEQRVETMV